MIRRIKPIQLPSFNRISHRPTLQIQELVALSYGLHPGAMTSANRERRVVWPRQVAMFLTREMTHRSLFAIGQAFGKRDHSTVIHAIKSVQKRMASDPLDNADVNALRNALRK